MWDRLITQNGIGGEAIVWLIIAFLWVVAQLVTRAKERSRAQQRTQDATGDKPRSERSERSFESEMRKFLENIGAEVTDEEADLPPEAEPVPAPVRTRPRRPPERRTPPPPPIHLVERRDEPARPIQEAYQDSNLGAIDTSIDESVLDTSQAYAIRETGEADSINAFVNPRTLLVNLNYIRMNMPLIPVAGLDTTNEARPRPVMHGRQALRDAITMQLILSNPLAMGEDKASYTKRIV